MFLAQAPHGVDPLHHFSRTLMKDVERLVSQKLANDYSLGVTIFRDAHHEVLHKRPLHTDSHCVRRTCASDATFDGVTVCFDLFDYLHHNTWSSRPPEEFLQRVGLSLVYALSGLLVSLTSGKPSQSLADIFGI